MPKLPSPLDIDSLAEVRGLLETPYRPQRMWPVVAAAAALAISALTFATAMIMAPPLTSEHVGDDRSVR